MADHDPKVTPLQVISAYDQIVRANQTPRWDTIKEVGRCADGIYGGWGEVIDTAEEMGYLPCPGCRGNENDQVLDVLHAFYVALQDSYRFEVRNRQG